MFTGIITATGRVREIAPMGDGHDMRLVIGTTPEFLAAPAPVAIGASIACSGCCLTAVALGRWPPAAWNAGVVLCMATVAAVYAVLLEGFLVLPGLGPLANIFIHRVSPAVLALFWLACAPKGGLRYRDTLIWCALPLGYVIYAIARGAVDGVYAYPFLNIDERGLATVATTCAVIAVGYLVGACAFVTLDGLLGRRKRR